MPPQEILDSKGSSAMKWIAEGSGRFVHTKNLQAEVQQARAGDAPRGFFVCYRQNFENINIECSSTSATLDFTDLGSVP